MKSRDIFLGLEDHTGIVEGRCISLVLEVEEEHVVGGRLLAVWGGGLEGGARSCRSGEESLLEDGLVRCFLRSSACLRQTIVLGRSWWGQKGNDMKRSTGRMSGAAEVSLSLNAQKP